MRTLGKIAATLGVIGAIAASSTVPAAAFDLRQLPAMLDPQPAQPRRLWCVRLACVLHDLKDCQCWPGECGRW